MPASLLGLLQHVLVRVPLECRHEVIAVCRQALATLRSEETTIQRQRLLCGWGPETLVSRATSSESIVNQALRWLDLFPNVSFSENVRIEMMMLEEFDIPDASGRPPFKFVQIRVGGPQMKASSIMGKRRRSIMRLDPKNGSPRLRDAWWSVAQSAIDGTPLPSSMTTLSVCSIFTSDGVDLPGGLHVEARQPQGLPCTVFAALIWNGAVCSFLTCEYVHFCPIPYCNIKVWGGVAGEWIRESLLPTLSAHVEHSHSFANLCAGFQSAARQAIPCDWHDSWTFAEGTELDIFRSYEAYDVHEPYAHFCETIGQEGVDKLAEVFVNGGHHEVSACPFCGPEEDEAEQKIIDAVAHQAESVSVIVRAKTNEALSSATVEHGAHGTDAALTHSASREDAMVAAKVHPDEEQVAHVVDESVQTAQQEEHAQLVDALMRSKADAPVTRDGIVIMRLKRIGLLDDVVAALLNSTHLIEPISRVIDAGCEVKPGWTPAILLVPLTEAQVAELDVELSVHHIIAHQSDKDLILAALKDMCSKKRPSIIMPPSSPSEPPLADNTANSAAEMLSVEVQHTFLTCIMSKDVSEPSDFAHFSAL